MDGLPCVSRRLCCWVGGGGFPFKQTVTSITFVPATTRHSIDRMNGQQMRRLKALLEVRQHELCLSIEHYQQYARGVEPEPDTVDQAASGSEKESLLQRSSREQQLLRAIDSALGRIRDGTYGKCLSCGKEIDGRRLAAVPWTPYCIQCEEESERRLAG